MSKPSQLIGPNVVYLVGSGASLPLPAGLPLFSQIRKALLADESEMLGKRIPLIAPELLFFSLVQSGVNVPQGICEVFEGDAPEPNALHELAAQHLEHGGSIWTTNYDTLIERAWHRRFTNAQALKRLHHPHGSLIDDEDRQHWIGTTEDMIFKSDQVARPWPPSLRDPFVEACDGAELVTIGYSGADVNARDAVRAALEVADHVRWYEREPGDHAHSERSHELTLRFPGLSQADIVWDQNPSRRLVADALAKASDLTFVADTECPVDDKRKHDFEALLEAVRRPVVWANVAEATGELAIERKYLQVAVDNGKRDRSPGPAEEADARDARRQQRALRVHQLQRPVWKLVKPLAVHLPDAAARRLRMLARARAKARSTWIATHPLISRPAAERAEQRLAGWMPAASLPREAVDIQLDRARALRILGRFEEAVDAARDAQTRAIEADPPLTTAAGRAEMEAVEALRVLGRFDEAIDAGVGRYDTLGLLHWKAWNDYELGCLHMQLRDLPAAGRFIGECRSFWQTLEGSRVTTYDPSLGLAYSALAEITIARLSGSLDDAHSRFDEFSREAFTEGRHQIATAAQFQRAELLRAEGDFTGAHQAFLNLNGDSENYDTMRHLGLAYVCGPGDPEGREHLRQAAALSEHQHSIYGQALACQAGLDLGHLELTSAGGPEVEALGERIFAGSQMPEPNRPIAFQ